MFYTLGLQECLHNLITLATPFAPTGAITTAADLQAAVRRYLAQANGGIEGAEFRRVTDVDEAKEVSRVFQLNTVSADPDWAADIIGGPREVALFERALAALNPELSFVVQLVFTDVALLNGDNIKPGSGVIYTKPGLVYFSPRGSWTAQDLAECFVHETTHMLLYWDQICHKHYLDEARTARLESFARTAITGTPRNGQVVFHSFVIAAEILALRQDSFDNADGVHGSAMALRRTAIACGEDLLSRNDLAEHYTPRAITLIERAMHRLTSQP